MSLVLAVGLIQVLIVILVVGVIAWLISIAPFIPPLFKQIAYFVLVLFLVIWLLRALGVGDIQI